MTAPGKRRNPWTPSRRTASRSGDLPRMYAFVIRISARNRSASSFAGMMGRFGLTTGRSAGVDTEPWAVSIRPSRASPSRSRISNTCGHETAANKAFPRLRGPPRKGFLRRAVSIARMLRETFVHVPGVGYRTEERLGRMGIRTWDDFSAAGRPRRLVLNPAPEFEGEPSWPSGRRKVVPRADPQPPQPDVEPVGDARDKDERCEQQPRERTS